MNSQVGWPVLVDHYKTGIVVNSGLTALNSYENRVYQFLDEGKKRYVVKFYRPERLACRANSKRAPELAHELAEVEIPVVAPLVINNATLHNHLGYYFALFPSVGGRAFEQDNDEQLEWVGRFLGRIHRHNGSRCFSARPHSGTGRISDATASRDGKQYPISLASRKRCFYRRATSW